MKNIFLSLIFLGLSLVLTGLILWIFPNGTHNLITERILYFISFIFGLISLTYAVKVHKQKEFGLSGTAFSIVIVIINLLLMLWWFFAIVSTFTTGEFLF